MGLYLFSERTFFLAQRCLTLCPQGRVCPERVPFSNSHRRHVGWQQPCWRIMPMVVYVVGKDFYPGRTLSFSPRRWLNTHLIPSKCIRFFIIYLLTLSSPCISSGRPEYRSQIQIPVSLLSSCCFMEFTVGGCTAASVWMLLVLFCWSFLPHFSFMFLVSEIE